MTTRRSLWCHSVHLASLVVLAAVGCGTPASAPPMDLADAESDAPADAEADTPDVPPLDTAGWDIVQSVGLWTPIAIPGDKNVGLHGVWSDGSARVVTAGTNGTVLTWDGLAWKVVTSGKFPSFNAVAGSPGAGVAYAVGMGGVVVQSTGQAGHIGSVWGPPGGCGSPTDCDDADPCTSDICDSGMCQHTASGATGCCGGVAFADAFDKGLGKWTVTDNYTSSPGSGGIVWSSASVHGPDGALRASSPPSAAYFGRTDVDCLDDPAKKCATFDNGKSVGSVMLSQPFTLPQAASVTLTFQLFLDVESGFFDSVQWNVVPAVGAKKLVLNKQDAWPSGSTDGKWQLQTVDLTEYAGQKIQLEVRFESYSSSNNAGQGVFLDDLVVSSACQAGSSAGKGLTPNTLFGAWAFADNDAWAVGEGGVLAHFDGKAWGLVAGGATGALYGLAGSPGAPLLAVGSAGGMGQVTSSGLAPISLPGEANWRAVAMDAKSGAWQACAVGEGGRSILGTASGTGAAGWVELPVATGKSFTGVASDGNGGWVACTAAGEILQHSGGTGTAWSVVSTVGSPLTGVARSSDGSLFITGSYGLVATRPAGSVVWTNNYGLLNGQDINAATAVSAADVWIAGAAGTVGHWDGVAWNSVVTPTPSTLRAIWAADATHVYAVGLQGAIVRWNGTKWQKMVSPGVKDLYAVWGTGPDDVFAVGEGGQIIHWDGVDTAKLKWTAVGTTLDGTMRTVWGLTPDDLWIAGEQGLIYHYDGTAWIKTPIADYKPTEDSKPKKIKATILAIWGSAWDNVWAAGEPDDKGKGSLVHWDGATWSYDPSFESEARTVRALWGWSADKILIAGTQGMALRFDGQGGFQDLHPKTIATIFGITGYGKDALLVGDIGTVLRWTPLD